MESHENVSPHVSVGVCAHMHVRVCRGARGKQKKAGNGGGLALRGRNRGLLRPQRAAREGS